ncbi:uncharacterized protein LOC110345680 [Heterocephalus glaber]|uniref:Uncharacterized protein LOC110345680 n=1 Tax=Heterocephalus glaber TaxID=10181 RepID=A0AAX6RRA5_HETGA|nr:uncharacterized protein LOC110345680 [Heterocephalus glaber]
MRDESQGLARPDDVFDGERLFGLPEPAPRGVAGPQLPGSKAQEWTEERTSLQLQQRLLLAPHPSHWTERGSSRGAAPVRLRLRLSPLRLPPSFLLLLLLLLLHHRLRSSSNSSSSALLSLLPLSRLPASSRTKTQTLKSRRRSYFRCPAPTPPPRRGTQGATPLRHFRPTPARPLPSLCRPCSKPSHPEPSGGAARDAYHVMAALEASPPPAGARAAPPSLAPLLSGRGSGDLLV